VKKILHSSKRSSDWQSERAKTLQRACLCVQSGVARGGKISKTIRRVSRRYAGRKYKSDPARRLALTPATLRQWWDTWKRAGQIPAAFKLEYRSRCPFIPRPLLIRFVDFCARNRLSSVKIAWKIFSTHKQNGRVGEFTYGQVTYSFSAADFYMMQSQLKAIETAQAKLDQVKLKAIADITNRLMERPQRRRVNSKMNFEI